MVINAQTCVTAGAVLTALTAFVTLAWRLFRWVDHQKQQDKDIIRVERSQASILEEQTLITYGLLACLKGLAEQGCDGPVTDAIQRIEKHINKKAHLQE